MIITSKVSGAGNKAEETQKRENIASNIASCKNGNIASKRADNETLTKRTLTLYKAICKVCDGQYIIGFFPLVESNRSSLRSV
jgi:hypothetical protein